jgi:acetyltransferase-like isoleucine patch superfamily enzyme
MSELIVPRFDANSETVSLVEWRFEAGAPVKRGNVVCIVESSKSTFDIVAEADGFLIRGVAEGEEVSILDSVGSLVASEEDVTALADSLSADAERIQASSTALRATRKAVRLAAELGVDLSELTKDGYITETDVREFSRTGEAAPCRSAAHFTGQGIRRVAVLSGGLGASQVIDILSHSPAIQVVGCLDDSRTESTDDGFRVPMLGRIGQLRALWEEDRFDAAIVALSTSIPARKRMFEACKDIGIPMINAIDPSVRINRGAVMGVGNVICSQVHIGMCTTLGDNNFISAHCSIDHHNVWGSHITTGPACATSALVCVADEVKFGSGVIVQPKVEIGRECQIASGAVIIQSVADRHAVKTRIETKITPIRD